MQIPVLNASDKMTDENPAYIIGREGFYLRKSTRLYDCVAKVKEIPHYPEVKETISWKVPRIPYALIQQSIDFFRDVYEAYRAEAIVLLTLKDNAWQFIIPEQDVSGAHLDYTMPQDRTIVGSIHSHGDMRAFFSSTDDKDAVDFDGIHIVIGNISRYQPEIVLGVAANGRTFEFKPEELIDGIKAIEKTDKALNPWLAKVKQRRVLNPLMDKADMIDIPDGPDTFDDVYDLNEKLNFEEEEEEVFSLWNNRIY